MKRSQVQSGYPFETSYGYARAVRVGAVVFVSGTTARGLGLDGDVALQLRSAIAVSASALAEAGVDLRHVVRTVIYVRDIGDADAVAQVHGEVFGAIRPASTLVQVAALTPDAARVEIEMTAMIHDDP